MIKSAEQVQAFLKKADAAFRAAFETDYFRELSQKAHRLRQRK
jgi:hypothetical protein